MSEWMSIAGGSIGGWSQPASQGREIFVRLQRRDDRWKCCVLEAWAEVWVERKRNKTEGQGDSPEAAVEACRKVVFGWVRDDDVLRVDLATLLRKVCYAASMVV